MTLSASAQFLALYCLQAAGRSTGSPACVKDAFTTRRTAVAATLRGRGEGALAISEKSSKKFWTSSRAQRVLAFNGRGTDLHNFMAIKRRGSHLHNFRVASLSLMASCHLSISRSSISNLLAGCALGAQPALSSTGASTSILEGEILA